MNILSLISAVMISAALPTPVCGVEGVKQGYVLVLEDQAVVAVMPDLFIGYEEKSQALRQVAEKMGEELDKDVFLTDDMRVYLILSRMAKRGSDDYERQKLAARLPKIKAYCYAKEKTA